MGLSNELQKLKEGSCMSWNTMVRPLGKLVMRDLHVLAFMQVC